MRYALFLLLAACKPQPASIELTGEEQVTVHSTDPVALPAATVKAKDGSALADNKPTWAVEKPEVAKIEGDKIVPVANGETKITATSGSLHEDFTLKVALPDKVEIAGATAGQTVEEGGTVDLTAQVKAGADNIDKADVTWASSDPTIATVEAGKVTTLKAGEVKITATSGALSAELPLTVTPKATDAATAEGAAPPAAPM